MSDFQCSWLLLLLCVASRANNVFGVVHSALSFQFAVQHDVGRAFVACPSDARDVGRPALRGGLCLRNVDSGPVVLTAKVGGRWSEEVCKFLSALAIAKTRSAPVLLQPSVRAAWLHHWRGLLACSAARSFAESLLGNTAPGVDGVVPSVAAEFGQT